MNRTSSTGTNSTRTSAAAKAAAKSTAEDAKTASPKFPMPDLAGLLGKLKLPGLDVEGLIDSRRKDVEALLAANEQAYRGFEAVTRRQGEMLVEAMKGLKGNAKQAVAAEGLSDRASLVATQAKEAFGQALSNMKEIAELSARSQQQVVQTLNQRLRESLSETGERLGTKRR